MNPIPALEQPVVPPWPHRLLRAPSSASEWEPLLAQVMQPGELTARSRPLSGSLATAQLLGGGVMSDLTMPPLKVVHRGEHLGHASNREVLVHIVREGAGHVYQSGRAFRFNTGDITFRHAYLPSIVDFAEPTRVIALRLPVSRWQGYLPSAIGGAGIACRDHALTRTVHGFVRQIEEGFGELDGAAMVALEQAFVLMLGATCRQFDPQSSMPASARYPVRRQQVHDYIDAHLFDAALSPVACAQALDISERYLHKVLSEHDERFSHIVQSRRLDASAARLRDPRFNQSRISSVAYQCGFKDAAHFSRAFSTRFGMAPRVWRAQQRTLT